MREERSGRRWSRIFRPDPAGEVADELSFHLEQRIADNIARGMDPDAARAAALNRLGDLNAVSAECAGLLTAERRAEKRREWLRFSWLDFKLGFRMLRKYPGLTIVGGAAIAFAIAIGAVGFEFLMQVTRPKLPLADGERVVALRVWDSATNGPESRALFDFMIWRDALESIEDIGVYDSARRNLIGADGRGVTVTSAGMTASGFRLTRVAPLLGRTLIEADERAGAPPVIVIGERVWRTHFAADPGVIGRAVRLSGEERTVVGVMPEDFAFPLYHDVWIPFTLDAAGYLPRESPSIGMFGRLAAGVTREQAGAELAAIGARVRQDHPRTHQHLEAQVLPYTDSFFEPDALLLAYFGNSFMALFLLLIYANVALLMFGRAATRESEMVVRTALGASRGRVVTQLFTEALVLGAVGAALGIACARLGMRWGFWLIDENGVSLPFWFHEALSPLTLSYAVGLTLIAALVAGVLPGLKVTRGLGTQLRAASAGGGGLRFGRGWTVIIVAQIAFTVAFFPLLIGVGAHTYNARAVELGLPAEEHLTAELLWDANAAGASAARPFAAVSLDLKRRLADEPGVRAVTFAAQLPGAYHPHSPIEVEGFPIVTPAGVRLRAQRGTVDINFFEVMGAPVQSGRNFHPADVQTDAPVVIVNESFARAVLGGRNPLGRRLRYFQNTADGSERAGPWYEIVGVVRDLTMWVNPDQNEAGIYHPLSLAAANSTNMSVHVEGEPIEFAPRLRSLAAAVDPALRLDDIQPLTGIARAYLDFTTMFFRVMIAAGAIALVLSLAGVYSIMSFTVARRTREIGIRVALGSGRSRVIAAIFSRAFVQVGLGVALGLVVFLALMGGGSGEHNSLRWWDSIALVLVYALLISFVCLLACVVPARRALRVQPTEALKADA
jgi:predicted permease